MFAALTHRGHEDKMDFMVDGDLAEVTAFVVIRLALLVVDPFRAIGQ